MEACIERAQLPEKKIVLYCFSQCGATDAYYLQGALCKAHLSVEARTINPAWVEEFNVPLNLESALFVGIFGIGLPFSVHSSIRLVKKIKQAFPHVQVVLGGEYPTHDPEEMLRISMADFVIQGDADAIIVDVAQKLLNGGTPAELLGIAFRAPDGSIVVNPRRRYEKNLDVYQYDFSTVDFSPTIIGNFLFASVASSRGCPTHCAYCVMALNPSAPWRSYSAAWVLAFLGDLVKRYPIQWVDLGGADFFIKKDRAIAILQGLKALDLKPLSLSAHVNYLDKATIIAMQEAGLQSLFLGLESCDDTILKHINKHRTHQKFIDCMNLVQTFAPDVSVASSLIVAYPFQTYESFVHDVESAFSLHDQFPKLHISFVCVIPVMGAPLFEEMKKYGYCPGNVEDTVPVHGFSVAGQWCDFAKTKEGKKALWYITYPGQYVLRYPAYGFIDKAIHCCFKSLALWRIRHKCYWGARGDWFILSLGERMAKIWRSVMNKYQNKDFARQDDF